MAVTVVCPGCKAAFRVEDSSPDQQVRCLSCSMLFTMPRADEAESFSSQPMPAADPAGALDLGDLGASRQEAPALQERSSSTSAPPAPPWERPTRPSRPPRTVRRTPIFVWLLPVMFFLLFLILASIGIAVIGSQPDWRQQWKMAAPAMAKVAVAEKAPGLPVWANLNPIGAGGVITTNGNLAPGDNMDWNRGDSYAKVYSIQLNADQRYVIQMQSTGGDPGFEPYLRLEDNFSNQVANSAPVDKPGDNPVARIVFRPLNTQTYRIVATTMVRANGNFSLTVRIDDKDEFKDQEKVEVKKAGVGSVWDEKSVVGLPVFRMLGKPQVTEQGTVQGFDSIFGGSPCKVYEIELVGGTGYTIELLKRDPNPLPDPYLALADPKGTVIARDDDSGGMRNSRINYTPAATGRYRIVACNLFNGTGDYTLTVRENAK